MSISTSPESTREGTDPVAAEDLLPAGTTGAVDTVGVEDQMKCPTTAPAITATAATNSAPRTNVRLLWTPSAGSPRPICSNRATDYLGPSPTAWTRSLGVGRVQPPAEGVATDQRDLAVGRDPVSSAQLVDEPARVTVDLRSVARHLVASRRGRSRPGLVA